MKLRRQHLGLACLLGTAFACSPVAAQESDIDEDPRPTTLPTVSVVGIGEDARRIAAPYSVVSGQDLLQNGASTLGEALATLPGVHADTFGGGSSRPVIRGQVGPRVRVLSDSSSVLDASDISPDHAVTVDPLLSRQIEVLRGPATLLYGGGAIGGVVNVLDNKIATRLPEDGLEGLLAVRANTGAGERAGAASITGQVGSHLVLHAEGSARNANDYKVPDWDLRKVPGTYSKSRNAAAGVSWVTPQGYVGLAYSYRADDYGLPGHNHEYEGCHPDGSALHCGDHEDDGHDDEHDHEHEQEAPPTIALKSQRVDLRGEYREPLSGISRIRLRASHTDYHHDELDEGEVATRFANKGVEGRVELEHQPIGAWTGVFGIQHASTQFSVTGVEAFLPKVATRSTGVFLVEHFEPNDQWHFELGARHEWLTLSPKDDARNRPRFSGTATSFAGAAIWEFQPNVSLTLSAARSERLPHAQELYARGVHLATNTYECGLLPNAMTCGGTTNDASFGKESSRNIELTLRKTVDAFTFSLGGFINHIDNYIYARTLDQFENFRLIKYSQQDAKFRGFEAEASYRFSTTWSATVFADKVRATFAHGGGNVPRIPASRLGGRLHGDWLRFGGDLELYRVARQADTASFESATRGNTMANLTLKYRLEGGQAEVFLRGSNILNQQVWNHTSFLADAVPLPGRSVSLGASYTF